jgi:hypothetical protein
MNFHFLVSAQEYWYPREGTSKAKTECQKDRRGEIVDETMLIWSRFSNETWKGLLLFW